jgi:hypothetical protein
MHALAMRGVDRYTLAAVIAARTCTGSHIDKMNAARRADDVV